GWAIHATIFRVSTERHHGQHHLLHFWRSIVAHRLIDLRHVDNGADHGDLLGQWQRELDFARHPERHRYICQHNERAGHTSTIGVPDGQRHLPLANGSTYAYRAREFWRWNGQWNSVRGGRLQQQRRSPDHCRSL